MFHAAPHLSLKNVSFVNNTCAVNGGAVYVKSVALDGDIWADGEGVDVLACFFRNNTSRLNGGAMYYQGSFGQNDEDLIVDGTLFVGNNGSSGGALCTWGADSVSLRNSKLEQNTAFFGRGGGIYTYGQ